MKALILGHGRHGKDTVAELLAQYAGFTFESSSQAAAEIAVFPVLADRYGYATVKDCYADRSSHREEWRALIAAYNTPDKARLCREILSRADVYVGMRCPLEYAATRDLFDVIVWVDASARKPADPSMGIEYDPARMVWLDNNGTLDDLRAQVRALLDDWHTARAVLDEAARRRGE